MTYIVRIECDNDSFQPDPATELARLLHELGNRLEVKGMQDHPIKLNDINGNKVLTAVID